MSFILLLPNEIIISIITEFLPFNDLCKLDSAITVKDLNYYIYQVLK
jgi:hypothetical protein